MNDISRIEWNEAWKIINQERNAENRFSGCADRWNHRRQCRSYNWNMREKEQDEMQLL